MTAQMKPRKLWGVIFVSLILGPIISMCYINKGRIAFFYFLALIMTLILSFVVVYFDVLNTNPFDLFDINLLLLQIVGTIHSYVIAKDSDYSQPMKWYNSLLKAIAVIIALPLACAFMFRIYCYEPFHIPSASMSPNIVIGDYIFAKKFTYNNELPKRGDIIVYKANYNVKYMKRVIGLPNDTIQLKDGIVYINNIPVPRKYISGDQYIETLPEGKEITIQKETAITDIDNTPVYTVPNNQYFVLGDNRDHSLDSRYQQKVGFIPSDKIIGKVSFILFNYKTNKFVLKDIN